MLLAYVTYLGGLLTHRGFTFTGISTSTTNPGLSGTLVIDHPNGPFIIISGAPQAQWSAITSEVNATTYSDHVERDLWDLFNAVQTLTGAQLANINNDLIVGWPSKLRQDTSAYAPTWWVWDFLLRSPAFTQPELDE